MVNKSIKENSEQTNAKEEIVINLDLKSEEYNISTDEEFHSYLKKIIKQLEIPDKVIRFVDFDYFRIKGTNFLSFTGNRVSSSILREAYESICNNILTKNVDDILNEDYPVSSNFTKKFNEELKIFKENKFMHISISRVDRFEHKGFIIVEYGSLDGSSWKYKYIFEFDNNYYLNDIYLDSKEMTHDSDGSRVPKPNSEKIDETDYDWKIFYLCIGNNVPEIWIYSNGGWDDAYDLFHREIALTENYKKNHQFEECLMPEKNYFYVDNAKNKDGVIANYDNGYVQLYAKFEDKDVLYDVKFKTVNGYVDEINVATNSIIYKDNTSKDPINRMYNIHELNDIEYAGQNVFDD